MIQLLRCRASSCGTTRLHIPFPTDLFCGSYDTHFGIVRVADGEIQQDVTYEGRAVPDRLKLRKP
jgi:hypothetical protein